MRRGNGFSREPLCSQQEQKLSIRWSQRCHFFIQFKFINCNTAMIQDLRFRQVKISLELHISVIFLYSFLKGDQKRGDNMAGKRNPDHSLDFESSKEPTIDKSK